MPPVFPPTDNMGNCFTCVPADRIVAIERFGAYDKLLQPGLHVLGFDVCGACISTRSVSTRIIEKPVRCETKTEDNVFVHITVAV